MDFSVELCIHELMRLCLTNIKFYYTFLLQKKCPIKPGLDWFTSCFFLRNMYTYIVIYTCIMYTLCEINIFTQPYKVSALCILNNIWHYKVIVTVRSLLSFYPGAVRPLPFLNQVRFDWNKCNLNLPSINYVLKNPKAFDCGGSCRLIFY